MSIFWVWGAVGGRQSHRRRRYTKCENLQEGKNVNTEISVLETEPIIYFFFATSSFPFFLSQTVSYFKHARVRKKGLYGICMQ